MNEPRDNLGAACHYCGGTKRLVDAGNLWVHVGCEHAAILEFLDTLSPHGLTLVLPAMQAVALRRLRHEAPP